MNNEAQPGQPLEIRAEDWNGLLDLREKFRSRVAGASAPSIRVEDFPHSFIVRVSNETGSDLDELGPISIGDALLDYAADPAAMRRTPAFEGNAAASGTPFAIRLEPSPADSEYLILAVIAGVCLAKVNVYDITHRFAVVGSSTSALDSATTGPVRLLESPTTTGQDIYPVYVSAVPTQAIGTRALYLTGGYNETTNLCIDGYISYSYSAGVATISIPAASDITYGVVTTSTQSFAGTKTFVNDIHVNGVTYETQVYVQIGTGPQGYWRGDLFYLDTDRFVVGTNHTPSSPYWYSSRIWSKYPDTCGVRFFADYQSVQVLNPAFSLGSVSLVSMQTFSNAVAGGYPVQRPTPVPGGTLSYGLNASIDIEMLRLSFSDGALVKVDLSGQSAGIYQTFTVDGITYDFQYGRLISKSGTGGTGYTGTL